MGDGTLREDAPLRPATLYGSAKAGLHAVAAGVRGAGGVLARLGPRVLPLRAGRAPGAARSRASPGRCWRASRRETSSGEQVRDFLHAEDVAAAFVALLDSPVTGPVNVASGVPVAVRELVAEIALATDRAELLELGALPQRPGEPPRILADVRRLREEVGFRPEFDLAGGVAAAVEALRRLA